MAELFTFLSFTGFEPATSRLMTQLKYRYVASPLVLKGFVSLTYIFSLYSVLVMILNKSLISVKGFVCFVFRIKS